MFIHYEAIQILKIGDYNLSDFSPRLNVVHKIEI